MDKYKKLATNTIIFAIGTFSSKILSFLLMPFVTRVMATSQYSDADLIQQTANVLIPIVFLQINSAALRFALDKAADKRDVFTVGVRTTLAGFSVFLLFIPLVNMIKINDFNMTHYTALLYLFVLVSGFRQLCQQFVRGCSHVKTFAIDGILATATYLGFTLLFLGVFHWNIKGYVLAIIASDFCSILFLTYTCKLWRFIKIKNVPKRSAVEMLRYSIPMMPSIILWWVINVSDRYMVTGFIGSAENGLYTAASKIPNFIIMFSSIFIDAWQLSAVDEYDNDGKADFFSNVFRIYSGGVFVAASGLILACQLITKILVSNAYYDSWQYVPVLIIATSLSCFVNFLASVYMASKKTVMGMVTALCGAVTNVVLNLILIPKIGANGAAIATACAFIVVFVTRAINTRKYVKVNFSVPVVTLEILLLTAQAVVMIFMKTGAVMYAVEALLFVIMLVFNLKPIKELVNLLLGKFLKRKKSS